MKSLRMRVLVLVLAALGSAATAAIVAASRDDDGCGVEQDPPPDFFEDTPRQRLCPSDSLTLTPSFAGLRTVPGGADDGGFDGSGSNGSSDASGGAVSSSASTLTFSVRGTRDTGQPHEAAEVDVTLGPCGELDGSAPVPGDRAVRLMGTSATMAGGKCRNLSDVFLECTLDSSGEATFGVAAVRDGTDQICARSATLAQSATVRVGAAPVTLDAVAIDVQPPAIVTGPTPMACGSPAAPNVPCANVVASDVTLCSAQPVDGGEPSIDACAKSPGGEVDVTLSLLTGSDAWLAPDPSCRDRRRSMPVHFDGTSPVSGALSLCTNGAQGAATLIATFAATGGSERSTRKDVALPGVPARLDVSPVADGGTTGSRYMLVARDCRGSPIGDAGIVLSTGATRTTRADGTVEIAID